MQTKVVIKTWGYQWRSDDNSGFLFQPNLSEMKRDMEELAKLADKDGYRIAAVIPITTGVIKEDRGPDFGSGAGGFVIGLGAFLQKETD